MQTSLEAWERYRSRFKADAYRYYEALKILGGRAADYEIANLLGWEKARVSARRHDCIRMGLVIDSFDRKTNPKTNTSSVVWEKIKNG